LDGDCKSKRLRGGGRKSLLGDVEDILADEIIERRIKKDKVTRKWIKNRAMELFEEDVQFKASEGWLDSFLERHEFSLRRRTNLTTLTDEQLLVRAVEYFKFLENFKRSTDLERTILMDETAVYFEDERNQTIDIKGASHVIVKSTGFSSMRITAVLAINASGKKLKPLIIHKGKNQDNIMSSNGVYVISQPKAWVDTQLLMKWIDLVFPMIDTSLRKGIIWDSMSAHKSKEMKEKLHRRSIKQCVVPGGLTPYVQAGDIGIYKVFKDKICSIIDAWKQSGHVEYTKSGNPKKPCNTVIETWVKDAWNLVPESVVKSSILAAGFHNDYREWHISKHDVYGKSFTSLWNQMIEENAEEQNLEMIDVVDDDIEVFYESS
jgi:hypothetical protein